MILGSQLVKTVWSNKSIILLGFLTLCLSIHKSALLGQTQIGIQPVGTQSSLPLQKLGSDDLIAVSVYSASELSGNVRLRSDGTITLPMLKEPLKIAGMYPSEAASAIADAFRVGNILVNPIVTVSVIEYRSRSITVAGAVRKPLTFQETGTMTLLDALSMCEGLSDNAGPYILVTRSENMDGKTTPVTQRISIKALMDSSDPSANIALHGGEEIRVPQAGSIYVVGSVKKPGVFTVHEAEHSSVLRALAVSEGLLPYAGREAYIYRRQGAKAPPNEIRVELKKITDRKSPDVSLLPGDILYVPDRSGRRDFATAMERALLVSTGLGAAALYAYH